MPAKKQTILKHLNFFYKGVYNNEKVNIAFSRMRATGTNGPKNNSFEGSLTVVYKDKFTTIPITLVWTNNLYYSLRSTKITGILNDSSQLKLKINNVSTV